MTATTAAEPRTLPFNELFPPEKFREMITYGKEQLCETVGAYLNYYGGREAAASLTPDSLGIEVLNRIVKRAFATRRHEDEEAVLLSGSEPITDRSGHGAYTRMVFYVPSQLGREEIERRIDRLLEGDLKDFEFGKEDVSGGFPGLITVAKRYAGQSRLDTAPDTFQVTLESRLPPHTVIEKLQQIQSRETERPGP